MAGLYRAFVAKRPNITMSVTNGTLSATADVLAQYINPGENTCGSKCWNVRRTLNFFLFGAAIGAPLNQWFKLLETKLPLGKPMRGRMLVGRVAVDQTIMAPIMLTSFIGGMGLLENRTYEDTKARFNRMFVPTLTTNWKIWPVLQLINFGLLPLHFRVPFSATCGIFWTVYLSLCNSK